MPLLPTSYAPPTHIHILPTLHPLRYDLVIVLARFSQEGPAFLIHACCCLFVYGHAVYCHYLHFFGA
jgi:hypothetical protein